MLRTALLATALLAAITVSAQQSAPPEFVRESIGMTARPAAPRLAERAGIPPAVTLDSATASVPEEVAALREWNDAGRLPLKNGFTRAIADPLVVRVNAAVASGEGARPHARGLVTASDHRTLIWSGSVRVNGADRIRLHLTNVELPAGATLWVHGAGGAATGFGRELLWERSLYTPAVDGPVVYLEMEIPTPVAANEGASFEIRDLVELVGVSGPRPSTPQPDDSPSCLIDATCVSTGTFDQITSLRGAIAQLQYVKNGNGYVCTGGLINDKIPAPSYIPYLLTANHCFDSQASASSLQAYFDYKTSSCNGASPPFPAPVNGAVLLATGTSSDFTFVQLNSLPGGRYLLGWTTTAPSDGATLYRVSHPYPDAFVEPAPQRYSTGHVTSTFGTCSNRPIADYIYSNGGQGGTYGGSSGSPVITAAGQVVGQLFGACGTDPTAGCDLVNNASVDGRFSTTFPSIQQYINTTPGSGCVESTTALCLNRSRFKVEATWQTTTQTGQASVVKLTSESGYLWFFGPTNIEAVVKVLDACVDPFNHYWVFAGGLTDVRVDLRVTDTNTGAVRTYTNPLGKPFQPIQDTSAFATCP